MTILSHKNFMGIVNFTENSALLVARYFLLSFTESQKQY